MRQIFRRNTATEPFPTMAERVTGFGIPNKEEKLKKGPGFPFRERQRVKVIAPPEFAHKTGYIVELNQSLNQEGLMEIELDYQLEDGTGYEKLIDPNIHRERLTIKNPDRQLIPYKYMKSQTEHFATNIRAESLLQIAVVASFILGFAIICLLFGINHKESWNHTEVFYVYLISQSLSVGLGFYCVLTLSFIGLSIKLNSTNNNLIENGDIHDDCTSYHWYKSTHWKPWWLCGRDESPIEFSLHQTGKVMIGFIGSFILSIILYISDHVDWYVILICIVLTAGPSMFAFHLIKNREMMTFA